jgi:hypothetical protein
MLNIQWNLARKISELALRVQYQRRYRPMRFPSGRPAKPALFRIVLAFLTGLALDLPHKIHERRLSRR